MKPEDIGCNRIYNDLAYLIPLLSPPQDYAEEASLWRDVLREKLGPGRHEILELGAGGGHNLSHLTDDFDATASDISEAMLEQCKRLNPGVELHAGDMRSIRLGRKYAAVLIHDAISYMLSGNDLLAAFKTAAAHLDTGGVFIVSPDHFGETFKSPRIEHSTHSKDGLELTYVEYAHDAGGGNGLETILFYLIREGDDLRIELDRHLTGLFPKDTWFRLLSEAGFSVEERSCYLETAGMQYVLLVGTLR